MNAISFRIAAAIVAFQLLLLALVLFVRGGGDEPLEAFAGTDGYLVVTLVPTEAGPGPYLGSSEREAIGAVSGEVAQRTDPVGTFGGYDGTLAETCDANLLTRFVTVVNPDRGNAWATAQRIDYSGAADFIATLSPTVLVAPTLATHHALDSGGGTIAEEVVLAPGTAVLADTDGNPRVRCVSGAPITPARPIGGPANESDVPAVGADTTTAASTGNTTATTTGG